MQSQVTKPCNSTTVARYTMTNSTKLFAGTAKTALSWTHTPIILFIHLGQTLVTNSDLRGPAVCSGRSKLLEPTSQ